MSRLVCVTVNAMQWNLCQKWSAAQQGTVQQAMAWYELLCTTQVQHSKEVVQLLCALDCKVHQAVLAHEGSVTSHRFARCLKSIQQHSVHVSLPASTQVSSMEGMLQSLVGLEYTVYYHHANCIKGSPEP